MLDLGSGGGIDVLLSAKRVGPTGKVYGLDMTDEMLALANANKQRAGAANVEFLKGEIEHIPLPDASVDVIISNCVINLSPDKKKVLAEAFRVLKRRDASQYRCRVRGEVPRRSERALECGSGASRVLGKSREFSTLRVAGFGNPSIEPPGSTRHLMPPLCFRDRMDATELSEQIDGKLRARLSARRKPAVGVGGPTCCGSRMRIRRRPARSTCCRAAASHDRTSGRGVKRISRIHRREDSNVIAG